MQSKIIPFGIFIDLNPCLYWTCPGTSGRGAVGSGPFVWALTTSYTRALHVRLLTAPLHFQSSTMGADHSEENSQLFKWVVDVSKPLQVSSSLSMRQMTLEFLMIMEEEHANPLPEEIYLPKADTGPCYKIYVSDTELGSILWQSMVDHHQFTKRKRNGMPARSPYDNFAS